MGPKRNKEPVVTGNQEVEAEDDEIVGVMQCSRRRGLDVNLEDAHQASRFSKVTCPVGVPVVRDHSHSF